MSHYFFAASLPAETKQAMKAEMEILKTRFPFKRWVHHEDLHITLAFLGAAPESKLADARKLVEKAVVGFNAFQLAITGLGTFGRKDQPRVFWGALSESEELKALREKIFHACEGAGFELETRPFSPHVTLARNWEGKSPLNQETLNTGFSQHEFLSSEVVLYRTHLDRSPKYEPVEKYLLVNTNEEK